MSSSTVPESDEPLEDEVEEDDMSAVAGNVSAEGGGVGEKAEPPRARVTTEVPPPVPEGVGKTLDGEVYERCRVCNCSLSTFQ